MSDEFRIVFEEDGYPCELNGTDELARALANGRLNSDSPITLYRKNMAPTALRVGDLDPLLLPSAVTNEAEAGGEDAYELDTPEERDSDDPERFGDDAAGAGEPPLPVQSSDELSQSDEVLTYPAPPDPDSTYDEPAEKRSPPAILYLIGIAVLIALLALAGQKKDEPAPVEVAAPVEQPAEPVDNSQPIVEGAVYEWAQDSEIPGYKIDDLMITLTAKPVSDGNPVPVLTVESPTIGTGTAEGTPGFEKAAARFAVIRPRRTDATPTILLMSFSGGAHCCTTIQAITPGKSGWKVTDLGAWDGEPIDKVPGDLNDDGNLDFVMPDNAFLYAFASYAESYAPSLIYNLINGKFVDVSDSPAFRPVHEADLVKFRTACSQKQNGACAAMVASAARLGREDQAFEFAAGAHDRLSDWTYPTRCVQEKSDGTCAEGEQIKPDNFLQALDWFLVDRGYIRAAVATDTAGDVPANGDAPLDDE